MKKFKNKDSFGERVCCVVDYHPALSCLNQIFKLYIVGFSLEFAEVSKEKLLLNLSRPKNLEDNLGIDLNCAEKGIGKMVWLNVIRRELVILSGRGINLRVVLLVGPTMLTTFLIVIRRECI